MSKGSTERTANGKLGKATPDTRGGLLDYLLDEKKTFMGNWLLNGLITANAPIVEGTLSMLENEMREWLKFFFAQYEATSSDKSAPSSGENNTGRKASQAPQSEHNELDEIAQICKLWGVTEVACWNIADEVATLIAKARKEAKHQQRHQPLGVSRWIAVGKEHNYWLHPMTAKQFDTHKQALIEEFKGMLEDESDEDRHTDWCGEYDQASERDICNCGLYSRRQLRLTYNQFRAELRAILDRMEK